MAQKKPPPEGPYKWKARRCRECGTPVVHLPEHTHPKDGKYWYGSMTTPINADPHTGRPLVYDDHGGRWRAQVLIRTFDGQGVETEAPTVEVLAPGVPADPNEEVWWAHRGSCSAKTAVKWRRLHPKANVQLPW